MKVLLPAFGKPSRPTSASTFNSSFSSRSSPGVPGVKRRGARLVELLKWMLPRPPLPPFATSSFWPCAVKSPINSSVSRLNTEVPTGTRIVVSSPPRPYMSLPMPFWPRCALNWRWWRKSTSVFRPSSATSHTLPPSPPSPPLGPPNGMNFSRRKLAQPSPPLPACTLMMASSTNFIESRDKGVEDEGNGNRDKDTRECVTVADFRPRNPLPVPRFPHRRKAPRLAGPSGFNVPRGSPCDHMHHAAALGAFDRKLHLAVDQREQSVVAAESDTDARVELGAALAHDDVAGFDDLAAVQLHAEVFRVGVAAVARRTYALFMCHGGFSLLAATGDAGDLDFGVMLPVTHLLAMVLAAAEFHDAQLVGAAVVAHLGGDAGARDVRAADGDALAFAYQQNLVEGNGGIGLGIQFFDAKDFALHHAVLVTAGNNDCVHGVGLSGFVVILG